MVSKLQDPVKVQASDVMTMSKESSGEMTAKQAQNKVLCRNFSIFETLQRLVKREVLQGQVLLQFFCQDGVRKLCRMYNSHLSIEVVREESEACKVNEWLRFICIEANSALLSGLVKLQTSSAREDPYSRISFPSDSVPYGFESAQHFFSNHYFQILSELFMGKIDTEE